MAGQTLGEHLVSVGKDDVAVVFGLRRRIARMEMVLSAIEKSGAKLLYITDEGVPHRPGAAWHFRCQTLAPGPLFNHVSAMAICHLLATRAIERSGAAGGPASGASRPSATRLRNCSLQPAGMRSRTCRRNNDRSSAWVEMASLS